MGRRKSDRKKVVIVVQVQSNLGVRDVKKCIIDLENFHEFFSAYRNREVIGVVGGVRLTKGVKEYAERHGLYIIRPSGENMVILNKEGFKPKIWT